MMPFPTLVSAPLEDADVACVFHISHGCDDGGTRSQIRCGSFTRKVRDDTVRRTLLPRSLTFLAEASERRLYRARHGNRCLSSKCPQASPHYS